MTRAVIADSIVDGVETTKRDDRVATGLLDKVDSEPIAVEYEIDLHFNRI